MGEYAEGWIVINTLLGIWVGHALANREWWWAGFISLIITAITLMVYLVY